MRRRLHFIFCGLVGTLAWVCPLSYAQTPEITAANTSSYVGNGRWDWTVYLKATPKILAGISCVEYKLHPTLPKPVQTVCKLVDSRYPFAHSNNGWGVFEISIKVTLKNKETRYLKHLLTFDARPVERPLPITVSNTARQVNSKQWIWTVFLQGPISALNQVRCVEYTLHPTFPNPIREVCEQGRVSEAFALTASGWGTFQIRIRVFLRNGQLQVLTHDLKF